jgi:hypothetical protein
MLLRSVQENSETFVVRFEAEVSMEVLREDRLFTQEHHCKSMRGIRVALEHELDVDLVLVVTLDALYDKTDELTFKQNPMNLKYLLCS